MFHVNYILYLAYLQQFFNDHFRMHELASYESGQ